MFKLQFKDNPKRSIWLVGERVTLGSHKDNTLVLDGLGIDEFHAEVFIQPDHLILKSKPGTCIVNDLPVDGEYRLSANDELRIGKERLLIIDPLKQPDRAAVTPGVKRADTPAADWELIPEHAKLSSFDFSIHGRAVLGRSKDCDLSIPYKLLSREHAELKIEDGQLFLKDLDSANGCFVNGKRVQVAKLNNGDKVAFAKLAFTVRGPETAGGKTAVAGDKEALNRTMIRPAIKLDDKVAQEPHEPQPVSAASLQLEPLDEATPASASAVSGGRSKTVVFASVVVVLVAVAAAWFVLQVH